MLSKRSDARDLADLFIVKCYTALPTQGERSNLFANESSTFKSARYIVKGLNVDRDMVKFRQEWLEKDDIESDNA